ncbi:Alpha/Beta hydrolase protein [Xylaria sp. FL0933]|nr:Alpha/Beta hydrolase protein [Xylaria sp. FL0933]
MATVRPFKINVPEAKIERLHQKLSLCDLPSDEAVGASSEGNSPSWAYGPPVSEIKRLVTAWQTYDWRKTEEHLNTFLQFIASVTIDGFGTYDIHHIHMRSTIPGSIPLLFLHGWPGSFVEATKIIGDLARGDDTDATRAFHVVAPSLIDFGFSSPSRVAGFSFEQHAEAYDKLMSALGYNEYVVQGGDVGHLVTRYMAKKYGPKRCKAFHTNTAAASPPDKDKHPELHAEVLATPLTAAEQRGLERAGAFAKEGMGYFKQMTTRPLTLGYVLRDSPVGLLAWIYEKLRAWSDGYPWTDEEILTWVSVHYFSTPGPEAPGNVYYAMEHSDPPAFAAAAKYVGVPFGVARFRNDISLAPRLWNRTLGPLVYEREYEKGGHFAAWERPDAIIADLRHMFSNNGPAYEFIRSMISTQGRS